MKLSEQTIQMVAQAVIANAQVLQSLLDQLPKDAKEAVAEKVTHATPAPAPVATPAPAPAPVGNVPAVTEPAVTTVVTAVPSVQPAAAPAVAVSPSNMPPAPTFEATPAPAATGAPFTDGPGLVKYVMDSYKALGPEKGQQIQGALVSIGYNNINDVKPEHYASLFEKIEALK